MAGILSSLTPTSPFFFLDYPTHIIVPYFALDLTRSCISTHAGPIPSPICWVSKKSCSGNKGLEWEAWGGRPALPPRKTQGNQGPFPWRGSGGDGLLLRWVFAAEPSVQTHLTRKSNGDWPCSYGGWHTYVHVYVHMYLHTYITVFFGLSSEAPAT